MLIVHYNRIKLKWVTQSTHEIEDPTLRINIITKHVRLCETTIIIITIILNDDVIIYFRHVLSDI